MSTFRVATPLVFASLGGLISERAGVIQIALEGMMLIGALVGATVAHFTQSPWLGMFSAILAGLFFSAIKSFFVLHLKTDQIITGTAMNIFASGLAPFVTKILFNSTGSSPLLPLTSRFSIEPLFIAIFVVLIISYLFSKTNLGLWLQFSGEAPTALQVSGVSVLKVRWVSLLSCGALAGMGGASLSLFLSSSFSNNMTAGRGFIALAALIFGKWKPFPTFGACLLFGFMEALQIQLQGQDIGIPLQFIQILPYLFTIIALVGFFGQSRSPKALGKGDF